MKVARACEPASARLSTSNEAYLLQKECFYPLIAEKYNFASQ